MVMTRMLPIAIVLMVAGTVAAGDEPASGQRLAPAQPGAESPAGDSAAVRLERRQIVVALISRLGSPQFEIREEATRKLEQFGIDAIEPLLAAAGGENLEVTCRAFRVLGTIYDSDDATTFDAAEAGLEKLATSSLRSVVLRARAILSPQDANWPPQPDSRRIRRWKRAISRIEALGGLVPRKQREGDFRNAELEFGGIFPEYIMLTEEWKGGDAGLVNLKRMGESLPTYLTARLPPVYVINGADVSGAAVEQLQQSLRSMQVQLEVQTRGRARLGVQTMDRSCLVSGVEKGSAADKAGLQPGDQILKYDGEELTDFDHLAKITSGHNVGDKVLLEVLRDGQTLMLNAELTGWTPGKPSGIRK